MTMRDAYQPPRTDARPTRNLVAAALNEENADRYWEIETS